MGIRNLNKHLQENCANSIRCINISDLSGKRIAVDISIYLYKYEGENALLENIYLMLSIFRHYNVIPVFIFDGKPPPEKKALLIKRKEDRLEALEEFNKLKQQLESNNTDDVFSSEAIMDQLKKQIVQINKEKIENVKKLILAYGATYYDAPGEADQLCALLVIKKIVWACLSEDMDLFVYGCTRVLRYFSLISHTVVLYYMKGILEDMKMSQQEFKEICVISGTDYNIKTECNTTNNLRQTLKYFYKFKQENTDSLTTFYMWLLNNTNYISDADLKLLNKINDMFNLDLEHTNTNLELELESLNIKIENGPKIQADIENIMKQEDFIFIKAMP
jgi:hypothetical protein